jgi:hypothetical protein
MIDTYRPWNPINALQQASQTVGEMQRQQMEQEQYQRDQQFDAMAKPMVEGVMAGSEVPEDAWGNLAAVDPNRALSLQAEIMTIGVAQEMERKEELLEAARNTAFVGGQLVKAESPDEWDAAVRRMSTLGFEYDFGELLGGFDNRDTFINQAETAKEWLASKVAESDYNAAQGYGKLIQDLQNLYGLTPEEAEQHPAAVAYLEGMSKGQGNITVDNRMLPGAEGETFSDAMTILRSEARPDAKNAIKAGDAALDLLEMLDSGDLYLGAGADLKTMVGKWGRALNIDVDTDKITNTETARQILTQQLFPALSNFRGALSEKELAKAAESVGEVEWEPGALRAVAEATLERANETLDEFELDVQDLESRLKEAGQGTLPRIYKVTRPKWDYQRPDSAPPDIAALGLGEGEYGESDDGSLWVMKNGKLTREE